MASMRQLLVRAVRDGRITTLATVGARSSALCARRFSSGINGEGRDDGHGGEDEEMEDWNRLPRIADPFERLQQHAQQFREKVELDDLPEGVEKDFLNEDDLFDEADEADEDGDDDDDDDDERSFGHAHKPHHRSHMQKRHDHDHHERERESHHRVRQWTVEERVHRQIGRAEEVDFEHGLRDLDTRRAKDKMYKQLLFHEDDLERVCGNCGELGHTERNCMLPVICSNCGDVGHRDRECPHPSYTADQVRATKKSRTRHGKPADLDDEKESRRRAEEKALRNRQKLMSKALAKEVDDFFYREDIKEKKRKESASTANTDNEASNNQQ